MPATKGKATKRRVKRATKKSGAGATKKINFIPNDPRAVNGPPMRAVAPRPNRTGTVAKFAFQAAPARAGLFEPGTPEFLYWQSREAALAAVEAFEAAAGPLRAWSSFAAQPLPLEPDAGRDLNAYYSRDSVSFFHSVLAGGPTFSGASTDCVAHEVGHAILDALRPDFWTSSLTEHAAFHEAFGDCVAMLTAFNDAETRTAVLAISPNLSKANFLESILEDLAHGVRLVDGVVDGSKPRRSLNKLRWQLPTTLPAELAPGHNPDELTGEVHSFARVFTGCFYDVVRNIFTSRGTLTPAGLLTASRIAGALLAEGARNAVENPRLYEAVGVAMLAADLGMNRGANQLAIVAAFANHGIALAHPARAFQPRARLAGGVAKPKRGAAALSARAVSAELRRRLGATTGTMRVDDFTLGADAASKFVHERSVSLDGLGAALEGVVAPAPEPVVVSRASATAAVALSPIPDSHTTEDEVRYFAMTLLRNGQIGEQQSPRGAARAGGEMLLSAISRGRRGAQGGTTAMPTHVVTSRGAERVLTRVRFACGCSRVAPRTK
ncbi:MAG TPA: hypothetical protein VGP25_05010 [Gemmatimonadaceae bacterium]|nr:hypothetical protein [Gemmatimonadaceae bacterium]